MIPLKGFIILLLYLQQLAADRPAEESYKCDVMVKNKTVSCLCYNVNVYRQGGVQVDCTGRKLPSIPQCSSLPSNTTNLILRDNKIRFIEDNSFMCLERLQQLDMSHNKIKKLSYMSFSALEVLASLNLGNNLIALNNESYPFDVFSPLKNLKSLYLKGNCFAVPCTEYPHLALSQLTSLEELYIDPVLNLHFGEGFEKLSNLTILDVSGAHAMPGIDRILKDSLVSLRSSPIRVFNMTHCHSSNIEPNSFAVLKHLQILDLTNNELGTRLEQAFIGLNSTPVHTLILNETSIDVINDIILRSLVGTRITKITFSNNGITSIEPVFSKYLPHLESMSLEFNHITGKLSALGDLLLIRSLRFLNISRQNTIRSSARLNKEYESLKSFPTSSFPFPLPLMPNFETFDFSYNDLKVKEIPPVIFPRDTHIKHMYLSNNRIKKFTGPFYCYPGYNMKLELFDISSNGCGSMPLNVFQFCDWSNMKQLILSDNELGYLLEPGHPASFLGKMTGLSTFAMEANLVKALSPDIFVNNTNLTEILLARNGIIDFSVQVDHLKSLKLLDLSKNSLPFLPIDVLKGLDEISKTRQLEVRLSDNPMECSCNKKSRAFLHWLQNTQVILDGRSDYTCTFPNNSQILLTRERLPLTIEWLDDVCESRLVTIIVSCLSAFLLIIVIIVSLIYRFRWSLLYWWYTRSKHYEQIEEDYRFDVFVSYGEETDGVWVRTELIDQLENEHGLRVCEHTRDFEVGRPIVENIMECLHQSRKVLLILTEEFLQSQWCRFESQMAFHMMAQRESDIIIPVIRGKLPIGLMTETLLQLIKRRTYIEWPSSAAGAPVFWARLVRTIRDN